MAKQIKKDMTIGDVLKIDESLGEVFLGFGMHCIYCPMSQMETLEEASEFHQIDLDLLIKKLNEQVNFSVEGAIKSKKKVKKATMKK